MIEVLILGIAFALSSFNILEVLLLGSQERNVL